MTLHHILNIAGTAIFFYALWMVLIGLTFILMDLFSDWYAQFKQTRKDKAARKGGKE